MTDRVCNVYCSGVMDAKTPRSELCDITFVSNEETSEVEEENAGTNFLRGLKEAIANDKGEAIGTTPKKRSCMTDFEIGKPLFAHDENEIAETKVDKTAPVTG